MLKTCYTAQKHVMRGRVAETQTPFSLLQHTVPSTGFLTCYFEVKSYIMLPYIYLIMETGTSVAGCAASTRTLHHRAATSDLSSHCGDL